MVVGNEIGYLIVQADFGGSPVGAIFRFLTTLNNLQSRQYVLRGFHFRVSNLPLFITRFSIQLAQAFYFCGVLIIAHYPYFSCIIKIVYVSEIISTVNWKLRGGGNAPARFKM